MLPLDRHSVASVNRLLSDVAVGGQLGAPTVGVAGSGRDGDSSLCGRLGGLTSTGGSGPSRRRAAGGLGVRRPSPEARGGISGGRRISAVHTHRSGVGSVRAGGRSREAGRRGGAQRLSSCGSGPEAGQLQARGVALRYGFPSSGKTFWRIRSSAARACTVTGSAALVPIHCQGGWGVWWNRKDWSVFLGLCVGWKGQRGYFWCLVRAPRGIVVTSFKRCGLYRWEVAGAFGKLIAGTLIAGHGFSWVDEERCAASEGPRGHQLLLSPRLGRLECPSQTWRLLLLVSGGADRSAPALGLRTSRSSPRTVLSGPALLEGPSPFAGLPLFLARAPPPPGSGWSPSRSFLGYCGDNWWAPSWRRHATTHRLSRLAWRRYLSFSLRATVSRAQLFLPFSREAPCSLCRRGWGGPSTWAARKCHEGARVWLKDRGFTRWHLRRLVKPRCGTA